MQRQLWSDVLLDNGFCIISEGSLSFYLQRNIFVFLFDVIVIIVVYRRDNLVIIIAMLEDSEIPAQTG